MRLPPGQDESTARARLARGSLAALTGTGLAFAAAAALEARLLQDALFPLRVAVTFTIIALVSLFGLYRAHPYRQLGPANLVTGGRAVVMACLAGVAMGPHPGTTWWLVGLASAGALADALDGPLARRSGLASRFGARFDMEVDALVILALSVLVWRIADTGWWVLAAGAMRYAFVAAGWIWDWMRAGLPSSRRRQTACVVQIVAFIAALAPPVQAGPRAAIAAVGLAVLTWSFTIDVWWLFSRRHT